MSRFHGGPITRGDLEVTRDRVVTGKHEGDVAVLQGGTLSIDGMVTGAVRIRSGGAARIRGMSGSVVVERGGLLLLYGIVTGSLHVEAGGRAEVWGTVASVLDEEEGAAVVRHPGARIAGRVLA